MKKRKISLFKEHAICINTIPDSTVWATRYRYINFCDHLIVTFQDEENELSNNLPLTEDTKKVLVNLFKAKGYNFKLTLNWIKKELPNDVIQAINAILCSDDAIDGIDLKIPVTREAVRLLSENLTKKYDLADFHLTWLSSPNASSEDIDYLITEMAKVLAEGYYPDKFRLSFGDLELTTTQCETILGAVYNDLKRQSKLIVDLSANKNSRYAEKKNYHQYNFESCCSVLFLNRRLTASKKSLTDGKPGEDLRTIQAS